MLRGWGTSQGPEQGRKGEELVKAGQDFFVRVGGAVTLMRLLLVRDLADRGDLGLESDLGLENDLGLEGIGDFAVLFGVVTLWQVKRRVSRCNGVTYGNGSSSFAAEIEC